MFSNMSSNTPAGLQAASAAFLALAAVFAAPSVAAAQGQADGESEPALAYVIIDGVSIPDPLADVSASAERGKSLFEDPVKGGCVECHAAPGVSSAPTLSGPVLDGVGARLSASAIRLWIVNPRALIGESLMPAYYSLNAEAAKPGAGPDAPPLDAPRLEGADIEDLVAFLESLK